MATAAPRCGVGDARWWGARVAEIAASLRGLLRDAGGADRLPTGQRWTNAQCFSRGGRHTEVWPRRGPRLAAPVCDHTTATASRSHRVTTNFGSLYLLHHISPSSLRRVAATAGQAARLDEWAVYTVGLRGVPLPDEVGMGASGTVYHGTFHAGAGATQRQRVPGTLCSRGSRCRCAHGLRLDCPLWKAASVCGVCTRGTQR